MDNASRRMHSLARRETVSGRWGPAGLYGIILLSWGLEGAQAGATERLWLVAWALPALAFYLWRTRPGRP